MKEEDKIIIATFMGIEKVNVGWFGTEDETPWQTEHQEWMDRNGLDSIGTYGVNVEKDVWFPWDVLKFDSQWEWIMPVVEKIGEVKFGTDWKDHYSLSEVIQAITNKFYYRAKRPKLINTVDTVCEACVSWITWHIEGNK